MEINRTQEPEQLDSPELIDLGSALVETKGAFSGFIEEPSLLSWRKL